VANINKRLWEILKLEIKQGESLEKGSYRRGAYESLVKEE
jgi:hypothetical protein